MKYKDPRQQKVYDGMIKLGTPEAVKAARIYGFALDNFTRGFNGEPQFRGNDRSSEAAVCYRAGVDAAKKLKGKV